MKSTRWIILISVVTLVSPMTAVAKPQIISGSVARVNLLELYTSEGCSSCPPADAWFSKLTHDKRLWTRLVPVALHVDYWDTLGWHDPFDSHIYTQRQQQVAAHAGNGVAYTPEFVLNGTPWNGWFSNQPLALPDAADIGRLVLTIDSGHITASFKPINTRYQSLQLHVAVLAFDVVTDVGAGENAGRKLRQDFLVIGYGHYPLAETASGFNATLPLPKKVDVRASRYALAAWVAAPGNPRPMQSVGGWLTAAP